MAAKKKTKLVRLVSTATKADGSKTGYFKTTKKSNTTEKKLELKMFDPRVRKHVIFKEEKMK